MLLQAKREAAYIKAPHSVYDLQRRFVGDIDLPERERIACLTSIAQNIKYLHRRRTFTEGVNA